MKKNLLSFNVVLFWIEYKHRVGYYAYNEHFTLAIELKQLAITRFICTIRIAQSVVRVLRLRECGMVVSHRFYFRCCCWYSLISLFLFRLVYVCTVYIRSRLHDENDFMWTGYLVLSWLPTRTVSVTFINLK